MLIIAESISEVIDWDSQGTNFHDDNEDSFQKKISFSFDGMKMYIIDTRFDDAVTCHYKLSTPFDVTTASYVGTDVIVSCKDIWMDNNKNNFRDLRKVETL